MHKFVCVAFSNVLFIFCFVFVLFFLFSLLQAKSKNSGPTSKDIKAYEEQTNFSKVELKKVIAAFDKEANKVFFFFFLFFFHVKNHFSLSHSGMTIEKCEVDISSAWDAGQA